jgi:hypothetical protein
VPRIRSSWAVALLTGAVQAPHVRARVVYLRSSDVALLHAWQSALDGVEPVVATLAPGAGFSPDAVVLTTAWECTPLECAMFAARGAAVVVIAAVPDAVLEQQYRVAGSAAYLAMTVDSDSLRETIRAAGRRIGA